MSSSSYYTQDCTTSISSSTTKLIVPYQYELDTHWGDVSDNLINKLQNTILSNVAEQSGLMYSEKDCDDGVDNNNNGNVWRQRQLRQTRGRGSNSLVAISSQPTDQITDMPCYKDADVQQHSLASTTRVRSSFTEPEPAMDDLLFESAKRSIGDGMMGQVAMAPPDDDEDGDAGDSSSVITRVDGNIINTSQTPTQPRIAATSATNTNSNNNNNKGVDGTKNEGSAYNYISTQSQINHKSSHTTHNPLTPPAMFTPNNGNSNDEEEEGVRNRRLLKRHLQTQTDDEKCTVIQGYMTIYTSSTNEQAEFENLQEGIYDAIRYNIDNELLLMDDDIGSNKFKRVKEIRMYNDPNLNPTLYTSAAAIRSNNEGESNGLGFNASLAILVTLGCILIALLALFVKTSKKKAGGGNKVLLDEKDELLNDSLTVGDEEEEVEVHGSPDRKKKRGQQQQEASSYSPRSKKLMEEMGIIDATTMPPTMSSPSRKKAAARGILDGFLGLFAPSPERTAKNNMTTDNGDDDNVKMDNSNIYDCDIGHTTPDRGAVMTPAARNSGMKVTPDRKGGSILPAAGTAGDNRSHDNTHRARYGLPRLFAARHDTPHSEVEAAYHAQDDGDESVEVPLTLVENFDVVTTTTDHSILTNKGGGGMSKKFGKLLHKRDHTRDGSGIMVSEIHEIYETNDSDDKLRQTPNPPVDAASSKHSSSSLRPVSMIKSPSELNATRTRSRKSHHVAGVGGAVAAAATQRTNTCTSSEMGVFDPYKCAEDEGSDAPCVVDLPTDPEEVLCGNNQDDGTTNGSVMAPYNGIACTGVTNWLPDCFVSDTWNPFDING